VLDDYNAGLRVPDDVPIVWPDDNFGYVRRFATPAERARSGGLGVYYHVSYLGAPLAWLWIDTLPPALIWSEMTRAYEQGARSVWIVNVGDIKNTERSMEFFLDLAWHADRTDENAPARFLRETAARDFGPEPCSSPWWTSEPPASHQLRPQDRASAVASPMTPYQPTELNEAEIRERLKACAALLRDSDALAARLPAAARDAYFQLVGYPVGITAAANERYFRSELARADVARGRSPEANRALRRKTPIVASPNSPLVTTTTSPVANGAHRHGEWCLAERVETFPARHHHAASRADHQQRLPACSARGRIAFPSVWRSRW
jgi:hypothetical protein